MSLQRVRSELEKHGLLLVTDSALPSVAGIVAREPIKGSWWSHPKAHAIYAVVEKLDDREDVLLTTLVLNKQTFVHARFWRDLLSVAMARDPWQMDGLSKDDRTLLQRVESQGEIRASRTKTELPSRLLVHAKNIHTETGAHAKVLQSWRAAAKEKLFRFRPKDPAAAKKTLESIVRLWQEIFGKKATLPWQGRGKAVARKGRRA